MQIQKGHGEETSDKIFRHCTNGSATVAIVRGDVVIFDVTDNRAVTGILKNTVGIRVLQMPASTLTNHVDVPLVAGVAEQAGPVTKANQTRNDSFLVQCAGYHDAVKFTGSTSTTKRVVTVSDTAGSVADAGATSASNPNVEEICGMVGITPYTIGSSPATVPVLIKGPGCL